MKQKVDAANLSKSNIDASLQTLEAYRTKSEEMRRGARGIMLEEDEEEEGKVVIEAEEYELLKKVKTYKRSYRELFNGIADLKKRLVHQQGVVDRVRKILVSSFETEGSLNGMNTKPLNKSNTVGAIQTQSYGNKNNKSKLAFKRAQSQKWQRELTLKSK